MKKIAEDSTLQELQKFSNVSDKNDNINMTISNF